MAITELIKKEIELSLPGRCFRDMPAKEFTTYKTGGKAELAAKPVSEKEFSYLIRVGAENRIPLTVLGGGANVLISDGGLAGILILTDLYRGTEFTGNRVIARCGEDRDNFVKKCCEKGLAGLEKTSGIPGTVGGAVRMNAGAFGQETFDCLTSVKLMDGRSGLVFTKNKKELEYGYRSVKGINGFIILEAEFEFSLDNPKKLLSAREEVLNSRARKQPLDFPSAGSVFKRPEGDYASRLIDAAGLRGLRAGDAEVSRKHTGFIINRGGATASDIYRLICEVKKRVKEKFGTELETEQILLGSFPEKISPDNKDENHY